MIRKLVGSIARRVGLSTFASYMRKMADGDLGPKWKAFYWWTVGKKTLWGAISSSACVALLALGMTGPEAVITGVVGAAGLSAGFLDKGWRNELPASIMDSRTYQLLAKYSGEITLGFGAAWMAVQRGECLGSCHVDSVVLIILAAIGAHFGLVDATWKAAAPAAAVQKEAPPKE